MVAQLPYGGAHSRHTVVFVTVNRNSAVTKIVTLYGIFQLLFMFLFC